MLAFLAVEVDVVLFDMRSTPSFLAAGFAVIRIVVAIRVLAFLVGEVDVVLFDMRSAPSSLAAGFTEGRKEDAIRVLASRIHEVDVAFELPVIRAAGRTLR